MGAGQNDLTLVKAICTELATSVATLLGLTASVTPGGEAPTAGWHIRLGISGHGTGSVSLGLAEADAAAITRRILGAEFEEPAEGTLRDTLRELAAQTGFGVQNSAAFAGLNVQVESLEQHFQNAPSKRSSTWTLRLGDDLTFVVVAWNAATISEPAAPLRPLPAGSENLSMILDIDLPMAVRFGRTELALGTLTRLGPGSIIDLGRSPDDPVEVLVSGRVVARGDVVVVGGNYGVRITDVINTAGPLAD
jgi:flagellar motor switch protein FliN